MSFSNCSGPKCPRTTKIKYVDTDYTLKICDQAIFVDTSNKSHTVTLPHSSIFPLCNKMRHYTVAKNGDDDNHVAIQLTGDDEWYFNRGYNRKMIRGNGEMVTLQLITSKKGKGYWACIDDIVTRLKLRGAVEMITSSSKFVVWNNLEIKDNDQILNNNLANLEEILIGIDGWYDVWINYGLSSLFAGSILPEISLWVNGNAFPDSRIGIGFTTSISNQYYFPSISLKKGDIVKVRITVRFPLDGKIDFGRFVILIQQKDIQS